MQKVFSILILSLFTLGHSDLFAQGTDCCDREAILYCEYNHPFMSNTAKEKIEKEFTASVFEKFSEVFNHNCFQVIMPKPLDASNIPQNEYQIEVKFTQATNISKWPETLIVTTLFFVGKTYREPVYYWEVKEAGDSLTVDKISWPSFLDKLVSKIRNGPEITDIVERFEKRPVSFEVGCDKEEFEPGEIVSIHLFDFKDKNGQTSREFNRIVVQLSSGEITNETPCDLGPDYYAFTVDRNLIELKYKVPEDCKNPSVKFTIYNSCDVLSEDILWMSKTQTKDRLMEKDFDLNCYDAKLNITGKYAKIIKTSKTDTKNGTVDNHSLNESLEVCVSIFLEFIQAEDMPIFYQTFKYYKPTSVSITGFTYNSEENRYMSGPTYETNVNFNRSASKQKIDGKEYVSQVPWVLVIDNKTKKAVKLIHAGYNISYEVLESEIMNSVIYTTTGPERKSETRTKTSSKSFSLGPVGEKVQDPTIKKSDTWYQDYIEQQGVKIPAGVPVPKIPNQAAEQEIYPDILVKSGDGKTFFGGEARRPVKKELEDGYEEENHYYKWDMTVKKLK
jgi:hypothetical protein